MHEAAQERRAWVGVRAELLVYIRTEVGVNGYVDCYHPANRHKRKATWSDTTADGRWRVFDYEELLKRDKVNLDIFWLRDKSLEESDDLPELDVLAQEVADDLQTPMEQFAGIAEGLKE